MAERRTRRLKIDFVRDNEDRVEMLAGKIADLATALALRDTRAIIKMTMAYEDTELANGEKHGVNTTPYRNVAVGLLADAFNPLSGNPDSNNDLGKTAEALLLEAHTALARRDFPTAARKAGLVSLGYKLDTVETASLDGLYKKLVQSL